MDRAVVVVEVRLKMHLVDRKYIVMELEQQMIDVMEPRLVMIKVTASHTMWKEPKDVEDNQVLVEAGQGRISEL